jgi:integrase
MPRPATGSIVERRNAQGQTTRLLRFTVNGRKRSVSLGVVTHAEAEQRLAQELADVQRGKWEPPSTAPASPAADVPTFHAHAERWWLLNEDQLAINTRADYRWRLERHLLPYFGELRLDAITVDTVERYTAAKLAENKRIVAAAATDHPITETYTDKRGRELTRRVRPLSARSINMTVTLLGAILESAVERGLMVRNPSRGKRRRVRERAPRRSYLDTAQQIEALLAAAGELDAEADKIRRHVKRRAGVAVLTFAGLRIGELLALEWSDVDLAAGWLTIGDAKTDAGRRKVKLRGTLRDELAALRADAKGATGYLFATSTGQRMSPENFRSRVLSAAVKRASANLQAADQAPLPEGLTPHSLRRTFASILYALGESPPVVMQEMGHTDPALALRVYAQVMRRDEGERAKLAALVEGAATEEPRADSLAFRGAGRGGAPRASV